MSYKLGSCTAACTHTYTITEKQGENAGKGEDKKPCDQIKSVCCITILLVQTYVITSKMIWSKAVEFHQYVKWIFTTVKEYNILNLHSAIK